MGDDFSRRTFLRTGALAIGAAAVHGEPARAEQSDRGAGQGKPDAHEQQRGGTLRTVGIMSPGDMGSAVGWVLATHGLTAIAALGERSARTRSLAAQAGIADVGTLENLVRRADLILSILDPDAAVAAAERVAEAMKSAGAAPLYADCNSISPRSSRKIGEVLKSVGAPYAEASIIGAPPRVPNRTRVYVSGPRAHEFSQLSQFGLDVRHLGAEEGRAKSIKVCYATINKATQAVVTESLVSAKRLGVLAVLMTELETSQAGLLKFAQNGLQQMPPKAHRWIGEMNELAATYQDVGLTPLMLAGAAEMYRDVGQTTLGRESPEAQRRVNRSFDEFIALLERDMPRTRSGGRTGVSR